MKKKAIVSVALAAALFAVSCQKENTPEQNVSGPMTISAVAEALNTPTKTELAFRYDVLWSDNDKIYVKDASGDNDTFSLNEGAGTTKGTFNQDHTVIFNGEVDAYYPATMLESGSPVWPASQTNDQTIPMYCKKTLSGTTDERMDFASLGSVLQIVFNTTQANVILKSIEITDGEKTMSGAFTVDMDGKANITATDKAGITLDLGTGVALGKAANYFNIAVPAGNYTDLTLVFTATDGTKCTMTGGRVNIACNTVGRLTLTGEKFKADVPAGALPGIFSVSATKRVHFSQGNLTYNVSTPNWAFYEHQYDCATGYDSNLISLFTWGYGTWSKSPDGTGYQTGEFTDFTDWGSQIGDGNTWRTLSTEEWQYLFNTRTDASSKVGFATVRGVEGIIILPDTFTDPMKNNGSAAFVPKSTTEWTANVYTIGGNWEAMETAGAVFLPAAGYRYGSEFHEVGNSGRYWSSTAYVWYSASGAYNVYFYSSDVIPVNNFNRNHGFSVRLITESK